jgi:hypothetical protein
MRSFAFWKFRTSEPAGAKKWSYSLISGQFQTCRFHGIGRLVLGTLAVLAIQRDVKTLKQARSSGASIPARRTR